MTNVVHPQAVHTPKRRTFPQHITRNINYTTTTTAIRWNYSELCTSDICTSFWQVRALCPGFPHLPQRRGAGSVLIRRPPFSHVSRSTCSCTSFWVLRPVRSVDTEPQDCIRGCHNWRGRIGAKKNITRCRVIARISLSCALHNSNCS